MDLSVLCSLVASLSYALFSRFYEPAVRKVHNSRHAAIILYALAGMLLFGLSGITALVMRQPFPDFHKGVFFNFPVSGFSLGAALAIGLLSMAVLYALHIATEAASRRSINMGIYSVIFQLNVVIIAVADFVLFRPNVSLTNWIGSAVILVSSISGLLIHAHTHKTDYVPALNVFVLLLAVISAISCGLALLVDGEMVRNFVFTHEHIFDSLSLFFFYEALTFLIPSFFFVGDHAHLFC